MNRNKEAATVDSKCVSFISCMQRYTHTAAAAANSTIRISKQQMRRILRTRERTNNSQFESGIRNHYSIFSAYSGV